MSEVEEHPLYLRACEVVHHSSDCPALGRGDELCTCDAVGFLDDLRATFLDWTPDENERRVIRELMAATDMSAGAVIRQALRLYQLSHYRAMAGEICRWSGDEARRAEFYAGPTPTTEGQHQ